MHQAQMCTIKEMNQFNKTHKNKRVPKHVNILICPRGAGNIKMCTSQYTTITALYKIICNIQ